MDEPKLTGASTVLTRDEIYLIGLFIIVWNEAEALMKFAMLIALDSDLKETDAIMSGYSIIQKAEIFATVIEKRGLDQDIKAEARACAGIVKGMADFRNSVAHGFWALNERTGKADAQKNVFEGSSITTAQIRGKYESLRALVVRLGRHIAKMKGFELPGTTAA